MRVSILFNYPFLNDAIIIIIIIIYHKPFLFNMMRMLNCTEWWWKTTSFLLFLINVFIIHFCLYIQLLLLSWAMLAISLRVYFQIIFPNKKRILIIFFSYFFTRIPGSIVKRTEFKLCQGKCARDSPNEKKNGDSGTIFGGLFWGIFFSQNLRILCSQKRR